VTVRAVNGLASRELIDVSADSDLVVLGSRGGGGFAKLMLGSVSSQVVNHAACPVVIIR
jgi:nucleotide-binding universal stress UspA family protein